MIYKVENISAKKYTQELYERAFEVMPDHRKEKALRYAKEQDKRHCVFSHLLLCDMLKEHFGIDSPEFYISEKGKPCLSGDKVHFSISHSGDFIACAVDTTPVGIDIETPRDITGRVLRHCCNEEELRYITQDPASLPDLIPAQSEQASRFLSIWTAKEAYLKYTGEGLGGGLVSVSAVSEGKLVNQINQRTLTQVTEKSYTLSVISQRP